VENDLASVGLIGPNERTCDIASYLERFGGDATPYQIGCTFETDPFPEDKSISDTKQGPTVFFQEEPGIIAVGVQDIENAICRNGLSYLIFCGPVPGDILDSADDSLLAKILFIKRKGSATLFRKSKKRTQWNISASSAVYAAAREPEESRIVGESSTLDLLWEERSEETEQMRRNLGKTCDGRAVQNALGRLLLPNATDPERRIPTASRRIRTRLNMLTLRPTHKRNAGTGGCMV
jgi:hypothetical protein